MASRLLRYRKRRARALSILSRTERPVKYTVSLCVKTTLYLQHFYFLFLFRVSQLLVTWLCFVRNDG